MKWIKFSEKEPPCGEDVLVVKQYLDDPYNENGYEADGSFWTQPFITVDVFWSDKKWHGEGRVTYWMNLPKIPNAV